MFLKTRKLRTFDNLIKKCSWLLVGCAMMGSQIRIFSIMCVLVFPFAFLLYTKQIKVKEKISFRLKDNSFPFSAFFLVLWISWATVSFIWTYDRSRGVYQFKFFVFAVVCFIILDYAINNLSDIRKVIKIMVFFTFLNNLLAWYEIIFKKYLFLQNSIKIETYRQMGMPVAFFDNTNDLATYLVFMIPLLWGCFCLAENKLKKGGYAILICSSFIVLYKTGSKANFLGIILVLITAFILGLKRKKNVLIYGFIGIILFLIIIYNIDTLDNWIEFIKGALFHQYRAPGSSYSVRINLILNSLNCMIETLGIGVGIGSSQYYMQHMAKVNTYNTFALHNLWLEILVEYGVIIGILFVLFYLGLVITFLLNIKNTKIKEERIISLSFLAGLIGFSLGSLSSSSNLGSIWVWVLFTMFVKYQKLLYSGEKK